METLRKIGKALLVILIVTVLISDIVKDMAIDFKQDNKNILFICVYLICIAVCLYNRFWGLRKSSSLKHGGIVNEKKIEYCRELPKWLDMDFELAYASLYYCSDISEAKLKNGLLGAILLKWSSNGYISIEDKGNKVVRIDLKEGNFQKTELEEQLYNMLKKAAGDNNTIDNNELRMWEKSNKRKLNQWYTDVLKYPTSENLRTEAEALIGLKKFLQDYSLIDEKRHIDLVIWEKYLIYAQLLGIADEVKKEFKEVYPDYSELGQLKDMNALEAIDHLVGLYINIGFLLVISFALATVIKLLFMK